MAASELVCRLPTAVAETGGLAVAPESSLEALAHKARLEAAVGWSGEPRWYPGRLRDNKQNLHKMSALGIILQQRACLLL